MLTTVKWRGSHGRIYNYAALPIRSNLNLLPRLAGNYIFAKRSGPGRWIALYVGIAGELNRRVLHHERWQEACDLGMDTVMAHTQPWETFRQQEERDLIAVLNPPMNRHHRTLLGG